VLNKTTPLSHVPEKKPTKKQKANVLKFSEFIENKQKLKDAEAEREKMKIEGNFKKSSRNK
jgi:hypothetical protein